jgi:hypothetical protein
MTGQSGPPAVATARTAATPTNRPRGRRPLAPTVRSTAMLLLNEELARARMRELAEEAEHARLVARVRAARKRSRRAEGVARRARLAAG